MAKNTKKSFVSNRIKLVRDFVRKIYRLDKRKKLKNHSFSLITNNCIGGVIYHDLGLKFLSPTINLSLPPNDYLEFLNNLKYYLTCVPTEKILPECSYPVGILKRDEKEVTVHFIHYNSFEEAKEKLVERANRVNYDNLFVIFEFPREVDKANRYYNKFKNLPFTNKKMITYSEELHDKEVVLLPLYRDGYHDGKILTYPHPYSLKRYLDDFDYISFFNNE